MRRPGIRGVAEAYCYAGANPTSLNPRPTPFRFTVDYREGGFHWTPPHLLELDKEL